MSATLALAAEVAPGNLVAWGTGSGGGDREGGGLGEAAGDDNGGSEGNT